MDKIVIIGAGECGVRAAFALREQGFAGRVTIVGEESVLPYERPLLSKSAGGALRHIRPEAAYAEAEIELLSGDRATAIDRAGQRVSLQSGQSLAYDALLIATGARARVFPTMQGCRTLRTDADAHAIFDSITSGASLGIIGGGFIGLEMAAVARGLGADVTVFEAGERLLARTVPAEIARVVADRHVAEGVNIETGAKIAAATDRILSLSGGETRTFDLVVAGVGAVPNTDLAKVAGIKVDNGICVDKEFRTSDPRTFAAGDCCNFDWRGARVRLESWKAAQDQGVFAAAAMLGKADIYRAVPWFWSDQFDLTLQVAGLFDLTRPVTQRNAGEGQTIVFQCNQNGQLMAAAGIGPGNSVAKEIRILEKLIERSVPLDPGLLADPSQNIKRLLRAA